MPLTATQRCVILLAHRAATRLEADCVDLQRRYRIFEPGHTQTMWTNEAAMRRYQENVNYLESLDHAAIAADMGVSIQEIRQVIAEEQARDKQRELAHG